MLPVFLPVLLPHMLFRMLPVFLPVLLPHMLSRMLPVFLPVLLPRRLFRMLQTSACHPLCSIQKCLKVPFSLPPVNEMISLGSALVASIG